MSIRVGKYRGGGWEVDIRVRLPDGTRYRERTRSPVPSKSGSVRWAEARAADLALKGKPKQKKAVPTFEEFHPRYMNEHCLANRLKPSTLIQKQRIFDFYLKPKFGSRRLDEVTMADAAKLKASVAEKHAKTANNVFTEFNSIQKVAAEWGVIDIVVARIKMLRVPPSEVEFYEPHEYERLVQSAESLGGNLYLFVLLGGDGGLRCGEMIALEWSNVDFPRGVVKVRQSEWEGHLTLPKSNRERTVVLTDRLKAALLKNRHLRHDRVLWREDADPEGKLRVTQVLLAKWMRRIQKRAGMKVTGQIHRLRHTFCSRLAMAGASTMAIKELAGHKEITTTQKYMHLAPTAKSQAIALLDKGADLAAEGPSEAEQKAAAARELESGGGDGRETVEGEE